MSSADLLRQARSMGYGSKMPEGGEGETGPRSFPLTSSEVEAIGEDASCVKAYGHHESGKFHIDHVEPDNVQSGDSEVMVKNPTQLSPS